LKKIISLLVSLLILVFLYQFVDVESLLGSLRKTDLPLLFLSLGLLVLLVLLSGLRLHMLGRHSGYAMSPVKAVEATFAANALNLVLPGKLGDILKATMLTGDDSSKLQSAVALTIWEKFCDLAMLFLLAAISFSFVKGSPGGVLYMGALALLSIGFLVSPKLTGLGRRLVPKVILNKSQTIRGMIDAWQSLQVGLAGRRRALLSLLVLSFLIWAGHILQICLMVAALGVSVDLSGWAFIIGMIPIAIVAGLVPLTFAGVGTRDAVLVVLLGGIMGKETAAALGVLFWLRYLVPGILGLPLMPKFMRHTMAHAEARKIRKAG